MCHYSSKQVCFPWMHQLYEATKLYSFNCSYCFKGLKTTSESLLPDDVKKDTILGVYWDALMASTYASAACNPR